MAGGANNSGGSGVGDIKIITPSGVTFELFTMPGLYYQYVSDPVNQVYFKFTTALLAGTTGTYCDGVTVQVPGHTISATQTTVTVDGVSVNRGYNQTITGGSIQWWLCPSGTTTPSGDWRLDVKYGSYWFAFIQDPGLNTTLHPTAPAPTLYKTPHIGFFLVSIPNPLPAGLAGMLPSVLSGQTIIPANFVVS